MTCRHKELIEYSHAVSVLFPVIVFRGLDHMHCFLQSSFPGSRPLMPWKSADLTMRIVSAWSYREKVSSVGRVPGLISKVKLFPYLILFTAGSLLNIGLYNYLQRRKDAGTLMDLAHGDSEIHCVFICCDLPYPYLDDYFVKLGESYFHPIQNSVSKSSPTHHCHVLHYVLYFNNNHTGIEPPRCGSLPL
jgi:hypothetical protein